MAIEEHQIISRWENVKKLGSDASLEITREKGFVVVDGSGTELKNFSDMKDLEIFVSGYVFGFKAK